MDTSTKLTDLIRRRCGNYLSQIAQGQCLYVSSNKEKLFSRVQPEKNTIMSEAAKQTVTSTLDLLGTPIKLDEYFVASSAPNNYNIPYVILPIGDCKMLWSKDFSSLSEIDVINESIHVPLIEKISTARDDIHKKVTDQIKDELFSNTFRDVEAKWRDYMNQKAEEHVYTDPEDYDSDKILHLVDKWMKHYDDDIKQETKDRVDKMIFDEDNVSRIQALVKKNEERLKDPEFFELSESLFLKNHGRNIFTDDIDKAINLKKEIIINCNECFLIDSNYYHMFIEENL